MILTDGDRGYPGSDLIETAIAAFTRAGRGEQAVVDTLEGVSCILQLADRMNASHEPQPAASRLVDTIITAGPIVTERVGSDVSLSDRYVLGMIGTVKLASLFGKTKAEIVASESPSLILDYIGHATILQAELRILCHARSIEERGNLLREIVSDRRTESFSKH
jgi:hypothetical protein